MERKENKPNKQVLLRRLPAVGVILEQKQIKELDAVYPHSIIAEAASEIIQGIRQKILNGLDPGEQVFEMSYVADLVAAKVIEKNRPKLRKVINATGIVLHTNMGRAVLAKNAVKAICEVAGNYSNLELNLETGKRGIRYVHVEELLCRLTGAEAALVVNNNAGAVLLVLNTLAKGREVIVSRGQLVEIGGSFRIPDVMAQSGALLVEVGTTNKTHLRDYENAITENTALLLKVHTSNYKIIGFTAEVSAQDLVKLGRERGLAVYEDLGSGLLVDFSKYGLAKEPTVNESIEAGVDVVTCSGDKLFGGPQAGIIVGRKHLIDKIKKNPLTRALRVDKFTFAAMEATLRLYLDEEKALKEIPTLYMITMPPEELRLRAEKLAALMIKRLTGKAEIEVIEGFSQVGGGALPEENIPTYLVSVNPLKVTVNYLEEKLRFMNPPIVARIQKEKLLFDPRTLLNRDSEIIISHLESLL